MFERGGEGGGRGGEGKVNGEGREEGSGVRN